MSSGEPTDAPKKNLPLAVPLILGLFLAVVLLIGHAEGRLGIPGKLVDSDCYMWLLRTERLHDGASWYDQTSPRSNAPYGETLHWGRPFDVVLLIPALALAPFTGFHQALYLWGVAVAPILLIPTVVLLVWGLRPLLTRFQLFLACGLFLSNTAILVNFYPAQPDHKCLNTLLFTAALGLAIRVLGPTFRTVHAVWLGLVLAMGLWSSMEMLFSVALLQGVLAALWFWRGEDWAGRAWTVSWTTAVFSAVALALHRPLSSWPHDFENDSLSSLQLILLLLVAVAWFVLGQLGSSLDRSGRLGNGVICATLIGALLYGVHPTFFHGPFGDAAPEVRLIWMNKIQDTLPLAGAGLAAILYLLGMALLAFPAALVLACKGDDSKEKGWLFLAAGLTLSLTLTLFVADRCSTQAALCALGPLAVLLSWLLPEGKVPASVRLPALLTLGSAGVALSFLLRYLPAPADQIPATSTAPPLSSGVSRSMQELPTLALAQFLNGAQFPAPQRILTHLDLGAELMYRTPHEVVATPYHRNTAGILDDFHTMEAQDDSVAEALVRGRGVTLILVCPTLDEAKAYYEVGTPGTLYERLLRNNPPRWLKPIELPGALRNDFQLWAVSPSGAR